MQSPLLPPAAALICGIILSRLADFSRREILFLAAAFIALAILSALTRSRLTRVARLLSIAACGSFLHTWHQPGPAPVADAAPSEVVLLEGCVVEPGSLLDDRLQFTLEIAPRASARVSAYLREGEQAPALPYGRLVAVEATMREPRTFRNPGAFEYRQYLARRNVFWTASAKGASAIELRPGSCGSPFWSAIYSARGWALRRMEAVYGENAFRGRLMQAAVFGDSSRVEASWTEDFRRTGTYHALVVSGLHITLVAGIVLALARLLGASRIAASAAALACAGFYALCAGAQPPGLRAAGGLALFMLARYFHRRARLLNILAAVAIAFMVIDPDQIFEPSFQLSFIAVAAIGAFAVPLLDRTAEPLMLSARGLHEVDRDLHLDAFVAARRVELRLVAETIGLWTRLPMRWCQLAVSGIVRTVGFVVELVVISTAVQFALALPLIAYFHRLSATSLSANILIVPLTSLAIPLGLIAALTSWTLPGSAAGALLDASAAVARWHAAFEPGWRIPSPPLWLGLLFVAALLAGAFAWRFRRWMVAAAVTLLGAIVVHPFAPDTRQGMLEMSAIDVGQGDSMFLALPENKLLLVDAGGIPSYGRARARLDVGEDVVSPYLWTRSIKRLDAVAMTHAHEDHAGGLPAIIENFRPAEVWVGVVPATGSSWTRICDAARRTGARIRPLRSGERFQFGGATVEVLAPAPDAQPGQHASNDDSLVLRFTHGKRSFLLTGDIERRIEEAVTAGAAGIDVLKVAHHGSRTSTSAAFLDSARPKFALISAGWLNLFRHPHPDVMRALNEHGASVLRTDRFGLVTVRTDGERLEFDTAQTAVPLPYAPIF